MQTTEDGMNWAICQRRSTQMTNTLFHTAVTDAVELTKLTLNKIISFEIGNRLQSPVSNLNNHVIYFHHVCMFLRLTRPDKIDTNIDNTALWDILPMRLPNAPTQYEWRPWENYHEQEPPSYLDHPLKWAQIVPTRVSRPHLHRGYINRLRTAIHPCDGPETTLVFESFRGRHLDILWLEKDQIKPAIVDEPY